MSAAATDFIAPWTVKRMIDETIKVYSAAVRLSQDSARRHGTFKGLLRA
jgi:hypothetical protein